jgi:hypothetical protein
VVLADFDGDADLDLAFQQTPASLRVFLNSGIGGFWAIPTGPSTSSPIYTARAADVDADGDTDLVATEGYFPALFRNHGAGGLLRVPNAFPFLAMADLEFVDIDEDGDLDIVCGGNFTSLLTNDGTGQFQDASSLMGINSLPQPQLLDFNDDGDTDVCAGFDAWYVYSRRRLAAETFEVARPGGQLVVSFLVKPLTPTSLPILAVLASLGPGPSTGLAGIRGRAQLDPLTAVLIAPIVIPTSTATVPMAIPPLASLIGTRVSVQGLVFDGPSVAFTNVVDEIILP